MGWKDIFLSERKKLVSDLLDGGYFKISYPDEKPLIIGYCDYAIENEFGDDWHGLKCVFFYNFKSKKFNIQKGCGVERENTLSKPTIKDYRFIEKILEENGYKFNRKKRRLYGATKKRNNI